MLIIQYFKEAIISLKKWICAVVRKKLPGCALQERGIVYRLNTLGGKQEKNLNKHVDFWQNKFQEQGELTTHRHKQ